MPISDDDKLAVAALLQRYTRWWRERDRDQKVKEKIDARIAKYPEQLAQLKSAFGLFGITGFTSADWDKLRAELGDGIYLSALRKVPQHIPLPEAEELKPLFTIEPEVQLEDQDSEDDLSEELDVDWGSFLDADQQLLPTPNKDATVREITIERLKEAGPTGLKAGDVRKYIENLRGASLHEKTVGMTLYRLSQEGIARREGRTWFLVSPFPDETKNPGAEDAGAH